MTMIETHRGTVSGLTHIHLLRESKAARDGRSANFPRVAVLGAGNMGSSIAGRLASAGFQLTIWNRTRARAEALKVGTVAESAAEAVRGADVVVSCLAGPDAIFSVFRGPEGALASAQGKLFIEMSTAGPELVADLAVAVHAAGARLVDAPLLGVPTAVREGAAAILVGGSEADVERATSILSRLGTVRHVGPLGSAARLKLVANSMLADMVLAAAELQAAGEGAGLAPDDVFWVLQLLAPALEVRRQGYPDDRYEPRLLAMEDLRKDLDLALELFGSFTVPTPLTAASRELVAAAGVDGQGRRVPAAVRP